MNVRLLSTVGVLAVAGALVVAGCSSSDDSSSATGGTSGKGGTSSGGTGGTAHAGTGGTTANGGSGVGGSTGGTSAAGGTAGTGVGGGNAGTGGGSGTAGGGGTGGSTAGTGGTGGAAAGTGGTTGGTGGTIGAAGDTGAAGEAGAGNTGCAAPFTGILYDFDEPGSRGNWAALSGFGATDASLGDSSLARSTAQGHSCPGALAGTFPFTIYNATESGEIEINYSTPVDWTGKTKVHAWAKLEVPTGSTAYLNGLQLHASSTNYSKYISKFAGIATFTTGTWQELVLDLTTGGFDVTSVNQLGLQVLVVGAAPAGGPAAPITTTVYLDDIWAE